MPTAVRRSVTTPWLNMMSLGELETNIAADETKIRSQESTRSVVSSGNGLAVNSQIKECDEE